MKTNGLIITVIAIFLIAFAVILLRNEPLFVAPARTQNAATNISEQPNLSRMTKFLELSRAMDDYKQKGVTYTVFAPIDIAFEKLPAETQKVLEDQNNYNELVSTEDNHVVLGYYPTASFNDGMKLTTVKGEVITINKKDNKWFINDKITVIGKEIQANNGVIHAIDTVMIPQDFPKK